MGRDVFISHSSEDISAANNVRRALEGRGLGCWMSPRDVVVGESFDEAILETISACRAVLVILSARANESTTVKREIEAAIKRNIPLIPFRIEPVALGPSLRFFLGTHQWVDGAADVTEAQVDVLVAAVERVIGGASLKVRPLAAATVSSVAAVLPPTEVERQGGLVFISAKSDDYGLALEAQQRMVGGPTPLDGVVADLRLLLLTVDHEHGGVEIEDQPGRRAWPHSHALAKAVMNAPDLGQGRRGGPEQEPAEGRCLRITRQSREVLKHAVLAQQLRGLDVFQLQDHRVQQGQQHLAHSVSVVPLHPADLAGDGIAEADPRDEAVHKIDAALVRQRRGAELDRELPSSPWHGSQSYRNGSFGSSAPSHVFAAHHAP